MIIKANNIELDYVQETLTIKKENNSFSLDFKVSHSSRPFLIIENEKTKKALGSRDITSINKTKVIPVQVEEYGVIYVGELQILSVTNDFRKCNLKYASPILDILNKKISDFMPVVSIIPGETNPLPYLEESDTVISGSDNWRNYASYFLDKNYPDVYWQFPSMKWYNKFGVNLKDTDDWFAYEDYVNNFVNNSLILNDYVINNNSIEIKNKNVVSPQLYLLSIIELIFKNKNIKTTGSFFQNSFLKKILVLSTSTNTTSTVIKQELANIDFNVDANGNSNGWIDSGGLHFKQHDTNGYPIGYYRLEYKFTLRKEDSATLLVGWALGGNTIHTVFKNQNGSISGHYDFFLNYNTSMGIAFGNKTKDLPLNYEVKLYRAGKIKNHFFHPTIDFKRYVPEKTVGAFLNDLKKLFNLKFTIDDFKKTFSIDFVEDNAISTPLQLNRSLKLNNYEIVANTAFVLKFNNDEDKGLYITTSDVVIFSNQINEFSTTITNDFKIVEHNGTTSELSEGLESKSGIGLMIYDPERAPYTSSSFEGKSLNIEGDGGIYESFWKKTLKIRLSSSGVDLTGSFTSQEINKINQHEDLYIDRQHYKLVAIEYTKKSPEFIEAKLKLESINL